MERAERTLRFYAALGNDFTTAFQGFRDNYLSFILTDFFEALHRGHYSRRCGVCKTYFLMTSARRQEYCDGMAPYELRGKRTTCRKYAAAMGRKELAENAPIKDLYNRRRSAIRTEKNRGTITPEFAATAYNLAEDHKYRALQDETYAQDQYREQLYKATEKLIV